MCINFENEAFVGEISTNHERSHYHNQSQLYKILAHLRIIGPKIKVWSEMTN